MTVKQLADWTVFTNVQGFEDWSYAKTSILRNYTMEVGTVLTKNLYIDEVYINMEKSIFRASSLSGPQQWFIEVCWRSCGINFIKAAAEFGIGFCVTTRARKSQNIYVFPGKLSGYCNVKIFGTNVLGVGIKLLL